MFHLTFMVACDGISDFVMLIMNLWPWRCMVWMKSGINRMRVYETHCELPLCVVHGPSFTRSRNNYLLLHVQLVLTDNAKVLLHCFLNCFLSNILICWIKTYFWVFELTPVWVNLNDPFGSFQFISISGLRNNFALEWWSFVSSWKFACPPCSVEYVG